MRSPQFPSDLLFVTALIAAVVVGAWLSAAIGIVPLAFAFLVVYLAWRGGP